MHRFATRLTGILAVLAATAATARGEYIVNVTQVGADVVATGSGSLNLAALTFVHSGTPDNATNPGVALLQVGVTSLIDVYSTISGPTQFGTVNSFENFTSSSGDFTGIAGGAGDINVSSDYVSGDPLSGSATWANSTISSLGLTPGTYTWTWGSGSTADSFVLNIGAVSAAPEPASLTLLGFGVAGIGLRAWRRRPVA